MKGGEGESLTHKSSPLLLGESLECFKSLSTSDPWSSSEILWAQNMSPKYPAFSIHGKSKWDPYESIPSNVIQVIQSVILPLLACCGIVSSWAFHSDLSLSSTPLWMLLLHFSNPSFPKSTIIWQEGWPYCSSLLATGLCRKKNKQLVSGKLRATVYGSSFVQYKIHSKANFIIHFNQNVIRWHWTPGKIREKNTSVEE